MDVEHNQGEVILVADTNPPPSSAGASLAKYEETNGHYAGDHTPATAKTRSPSPEELPEIIENPGDKLVQLAAARVKYSEELKKTTYEAPKGSRVQDE
jgi:hypothetical protein